MKTERQIAPIIIPLLQASLNLYAPESLYVKSEREVYFGIAITSGSVVSPALKEKQKQNAVKIEPLGEGIITRQIASSRFFERSVAHSSVLSAVFCMIGLICRKAIGQ